MTGTELEKTAPREFEKMFVSFMNHELRGTLNIILGYGSMLMEDWFGALQPAQRENMTVVMDASNRLLEQLNDLVQAWRATTGDLGCRSDVVTLGDVVYEEVEKERRVAEEKGIDLTSEGSDVRLVTDREFLALVLHHLIENAVKYTDSGRVAISWRRGAGEVTVKVEDTGIGIPPQEHYKVFTTFFRSAHPDAQRTRGTGIGLFLSARLAENVLHGHLSFESTLGQGSTFTLRLSVSS